MTEATPGKLTLASPNAYHQRLVAGLRERDEHSAAEAIEELHAALSMERKAAADEIERLQSDVTELMTIANAYANEPKTSPEEAP